MKVPIISFMCGRNICVITLYPYLEFTTLGCIVYVSKHQTNFCGISSEKNLCNLCKNNFVHSICKSKGGSVILQLLV